MNSSIFKPQTGQQKLILIIIVAILVVGAILAIYFYLIKKQETPPKSTNQTQVQSESDLNQTHLDNTNLTNQSDQSTEPTQEEAEKILKVYTHERFIISLVANQSTGYSWWVDLNSDFLKLVSKEYTLGPTKRPEDGGGESFTLEALKAGETEITFSYFKKGEDRTTAQPKEQQFFKVVIESNEPTTPPETPLNENPN